MFTTKSGAQANLKEGSVFTVFQGFFYYRTLLTEKKQLNALNLR